VTTNEEVGPIVVLPGIPATVDPQPVIAQMVRRASSLGFESWWHRAQSVGFCAAPIQLVGTDQYDRQRIVWVRCNNRRASVCPSCSDLYARDTWQLVAAGTSGGRHHIPATVSTHPQVFATLTAPGFGAVHSSAGTVCRDHRGIGGYQRCMHGKPLWCSITHNHGDVMVGQPLCRDCYDYLGHALFTWHLPELWRRFTIALRRAISRTLKTRCIEPCSVRLSSVKVVEMQARAVPHIHALIRLDPPQGPASAATTGSSDENIHGPAATPGGGEHRSQTGTGWEPPITAPELAALIHQTARSVSVDMPDPAVDNPANAGLRTVRFGTQIDTQPLSTEKYSVRTDSDVPTSPERLSPRRIAGYLAKYVTKSLQDLGISAGRLSIEAIADLQVSEHRRAILTTIAALRPGVPPRHRHAVRDRAVATHPGLSRPYHHQIAPLLHHDGRPPRHPRHLDSTTSRQRVFITTSFASRSSRAMRRNVVGVRLRRTRQRR
jgi:hypothetical protein